MSKQKVEEFQKYVGVPEAAVLLNKTEAAIYRMVARRQIPFRKLNGRLIFIVCELEQLVEGLPGVTLDEVSERMN